MIGKSAKQTVWNEYQAFSLSYNMAPATYTTPPLLSVSSTGDTGKTKKERHLSDEKEEGGGGGAKS